MRLPRFLRRNVSRLPEGWIRDEGPPDPARTLARSRDGTYHFAHQRWDSRAGVTFGSTVRLVWQRAKTAAASLARAVESRAITSLPWNVGGSRFDKPMASITEATRLGPVFAAGRLLATSISSLPLHTYRKVGRVREQLPDAPLFAKPARHGNLRDWLFRAMTSLVYTGNAVGWVLRRDGLGYPTMIEWLDVNKVHVEDWRPTGPGSYMQPIWRYAGRVIPEEDIVHIAWFPIPMKILGLSPIEAYASQWYSAMNVWEFVGDWFTAGGIPPGTFKNTARMVSQEESNKIKAILTAAIRTHEPLVFGKDWEFTPFTIKPTDAALVELLKLTATDVAAIYGIPAEKIGGQTGSNLTYQTVELQGLDYLQFTLLGWVTLLESHFFDLLPRPRYVKFNVDSIIRPDLLTRHRVYEIARRIGLRSIDELRELDDLPPLPDGAGSSYAPLQVAVSQATAPTTEQAPPTPRDSDDPEEHADEPEADEPRFLFGPAALLALERLRDPVLNGQR